MTDELTTKIKFYGGVSELPKTVVKAKEGYVADGYRVLGLEVIIADDLPPGTLAIMGYRNKDGTFREGFGRLIEG